MKLNFVAWRPGFTAVTKENWMRLILEFVASWFSSPFFCRYIGLVLPSGPLYASCKAESLPGIVMSLFTRSCTMHGTTVTSLDV